MKDNKTLDEKSLEEVNGGKIVSTGDTDDDWVLNAICPNCHLDDKVKQLVSLYSKTSIYMTCYCDRCQQAFNVDTTNPENVIKRPKQ